MFSTPSRSLYVQPGLGTRYIGQWLINMSLHQTTWRECGTLALSLNPRVSTVGLGWELKICIPKSSQMTLMLLEPHFENY